MEKNFQLQNPKNNFIKSFTELRKLPLTLTQITLIEFVLSYTNNNQDCYASSKKIADYLKIKNDKSVNNLISKMVKLGYLFTDTNSTYNKEKEDFDGKTRYITVNFELINSMINNVEVKSPTKKSSTSTPTIERPVASLPAQKSIKKTDDNATVNCFKLFESLNCFSIGDLFAVSKHYRKTNITLIEAIQGIEEIKQYNSKYPKMPPMPELPNDIIERITEKFNELVYEIAC